MSFISGPLTTFLSIKLVNILSISVALCVVILIGCVIEGYRFILYIELMKSVVGVGLNPNMLFGKAQIVGFYEHLFCINIFKIICFWEKKQKTC